MIRGSPNRFLLVFCGIPLALSACHLQAQVQFHSFAGATGSPTPVEFVGSSVDGAVLAGRALISMPEGPVTTAIRWTGSTGIQELGFLSSPNESREALGVSGNGQTIMGIAANNSSPFRWTSASGMTPLNGLPYAAGISRDGQVFIGIFNSGAAIQNSTGVHPLGGLNSSGFGAARAANADGSVVVGEARDAASVASFRWTANGGMVSLGEAPNGGIGTSGALGVSGDGNTVIGWFELAGGPRNAYRWTPATGMVSIGLSGSSTDARGVSDDGRLVVGSYDYVTNNQRGFLWTPELGTVDVRSYLIANGATGLEDYRLSSVACVSADGRVIAGGARRISTNAFEAWYAVIPAPGSSAVAIAGFVLAVRRRRPACSR